MVEFQSVETDEFFSYQDTRLGWTLRNLIKNSDEGITSRFTGKDPVQRREVEGILKSQIEGLKHHIDAQISDTSDVEEFDL